MKPTTFSPCSATMPMQLRCRRQRRKSSSVQANSKLSCSVCKTSGMSRRIIQRICTRSCKPSSSARSEEHTSELQSHSDLVCRLLLEKKNAVLGGEQALAYAFEVA